jgi:molybdenum cofactor cytidylyltransferase
MIVAVVLAAGLSRRMGSFKLLLPWKGSSTVIGQVVASLEAAGLAPSEIVVVIGHRGEEVALALAGRPVRTITNPCVEGEMFSSIRAGLGSLGTEGVEAALICLGDQPQMLPTTVRVVLAAGEATRWNRVVIPSYHMRAGHPILLPRALWPAILRASSATATPTLRDVLDAHRELIEYVTVDTATVLADLDTPEDYERERFL